MTRATRAIRSAALVALVAVGVACTSSDGGHDMFEITLDGDAEPFLVSRIDGRLVAASATPSVDSSVDVMAPPEDFDLPLSQFGQIEPDSDSVIFVGRIPSSSIEIALFSTFIEGRNEHGIGRLAYSSSLGGLALATSAESDPPSLIHTAVARRGVELSFIVWGPLPHGTSVVRLTARDGEPQAVLPRGRTAAFMIEEQVALSGVTLEATDADGETVASGQIHMAP